MNTIEVAPINVEAAKDAEQKTDLILANANELVIKNQVYYEQAAIMLLSIKEKASELDSLRKSMTKPLDETKRKIMDLFRFPLDKLSKAELKIKNTMLNYMKEQERIRREQELKLQAEAEKKRKELEEKAAKAREEGKEAKAEQYETKAENAVAPVLAPRVDKVKGIVTKTIWRAKITNLGAIPKEYLIPNMEALNKIATATKGAIAIPGIVFVSEEIISAGK